MPFYVYILFSQEIDQYYVGHCEDLGDRFYRHNNSGSKSTKKANDWVIVYTELFNSKPEAVKREMEIKKKKAGNILNGLLVQLARASRKHSGRSSRYRSG